MSFTKTLLLLLSLLLMAAPGWAGDMKKPLLTIGYSAANHGETDPCG